MLDYLARRGRLNREGRGTQVHYALNPSPSGTDLTAMKLERGRRPWDKEWHVCTYDIPTTQNSLRTRLSRTLRELGFAPSAAVRGSRPTTGPTCCETLWPDRNARGASTGFAARPWLP